MHKFNYKGCEFEIGLTTLESDNYIIARLLTPATDLLGDSSYNNYRLFIGDIYQPNNKQVVIVSKHYTAVKRAEYEKHSRKSYADLINYLEKLCKPEPVTLEDIYKECEGKTLEELIIILDKYEYRIHKKDNTWSEWERFQTLEFCHSENYTLGTRQIRRKEGC